MTKIVELHAGEKESPLLLLRQCKHLRRELVARVHESFEQFSSEALPLFVDGTQLFRRAAERQWHPEHIDFALQEVRELEALCLRTGQLLRCYQEILTAPPTLDAATSRTDLACASKPSDHG